MMHLLAVRAYSELSVMASAVRAFSRSVLGRDNDSHSQMGKPRSGGVEIYPKSHGQGMAELGAEARTRHARLPFSCLWSQSPGSPDLPGPGEVLSCFHAS